MVNTLPATPQLVALSLLFAVGCATGGAGTQGTDDPTDAAVNLPPTVAGVPDPGIPGSEPDVGAGPPGPTAMERAQSAMEGAVLGAVIGAQAGPIGAAVGAGTLLVYGAITGDVPLSGTSGPPASRGPTERDREQEMEEELDREADRGEALEDEIEAELARQEELLRQLEQEETALEPEPTGTESPAPTETALAERADPRAAPVIPEDRELPLAIFDKENVTIPAGAWGNRRDISVQKRSLDADLDGQPEQIRYFDPKSGEMLRVEQDQDYDGDLDTWSNYEDGALVAREVDADGDGRPDIWELYAEGRMTSREVDRDHDGDRDAFYEFQGDSLVAERHDANGDGKTDLAVSYENRLRVRATEDRDHDGRVDIWTTYGAHDGEEYAERIERDTDGSGKPDVFESHTISDGRPVLARREEDKNGDGEIDITSIYESGRLVRREISDPSLVPL